MNSDGGDFMSLDRDRDLGGGALGAGDLLFQYDKDDVNAFFEKVLSGVGNTDPYLRRLGEWMKKACAENNLLQVIQGALHLAVLYQAETMKMAMGPRPATKDEGTQTQTLEVEVQKIEGKRRKKRRLEDSRMSENDSSDESDDDESPQNAGQSGPDDARKQSVRPKSGVIGVVQGEGVIEANNDGRQNKDSQAGHLALDKDKESKRSDLNGGVRDAEVQTQGNRIIQAVNDDTQESDSQIESRSIPNDDDDRQSVWSDLMGRGYGGSLDLADFMDQDESSRPMSPEDIEIVPGSDAGSNSAPPIPNIEVPEYIEIVSNADAPDATSTSKQIDPTPATVFWAPPAIDSAPALTPAKNADSTADRNSNSTESSTPKCPDSTQARNSDSTTPKGSTESPPAIISDSTQAKNSPPTIHPTTSTKANESPNPNESVDELAGSNSAGNTEQIQEEVVLESEEEELPPPDFENEDSTSAIQSSEIQRDKPIPTCHICNKTFPRESRLKSHLRVHIGDRAFPCTHPGCGAAFKWKSYLTRHIRNHKVKQKAKKASTPAKASSRKRNNAGKLRDDDQQSARPSVSENKGVQKNVRRQGIRGKRRFSNIDNDTIEENESTKAKKTQRNPDPEHDDDELPTISDSPARYPKKKQRQADVFELEEEELDNSFLPEDVEIDPDYEPDSSEDSDSAETLKKLSPPNVKNKDSNKSSAKQKQRQEEDALDLEEVDMAVPVPVPVLPEDIGVDPDSASGSDKELNSSVSNIDIEGIEDNVEHHSEDDEQEGNKQKCHICKKTFPDRRKLNRHLTVHTGEASASSSIEDFETLKKLPPGEKEDLTPAKTSSTKGNNSSKVTVADNLNQHLRVNTGQSQSQSKRLYPCPHPGCDKIFQWRDNMTLHFVLHNDPGKRPFKCTFPGCSEAFDQPESLTGHEKIHERPFKCDFEGCLKSFRKAGCLKAHKQKHVHAKTSLKDIPGSSASATSTQAEDLQLQRPETTSAKAANPRPFKCDFPGCKESFSQAFSLQLHQITHTAKKPFKCASCGEAFNDPTIRKEHCKTCPSPNTNNNTK